MNDIENHIIYESKLYINKGNLDALKQRWYEFKEETDFGRDVAWDYIFQKIYLHAALKKQQAICQWLDTIFLEFNPIMQIALRQMFPYARRLLNKK